LMKMTAISDATADGDADLALCGALSIIT